MKFAEKILGTQFSKDQKRHAKMLTAMIDLTYKGIYGIIKSAFINRRTFQKF